jgi:hypothetical protein
MRRKNLRFRRLPALAGDKSSVAALEFAIVLPLMLVLLAGVYDLSEAVVIRSQVYAAAQTMAASASNLATAPNDGSTALYYDQVQQVESTIWGLVPTLASGQKVSTPISVTISSIFFFPNVAQACTYKGNVSCNYWAEMAWSESYTGANTGTTFDYQTPQAAVASECASIVRDQSNQVSTSTVLTGTQNVSEFRTLNLSNDLTTASPNGYLATAPGIPPMLAVSVEFTYRPLFGVFLTGPLTFWVDSYFPVRSVKSQSASQAGQAVAEPLAFQYTTLIGNPAGGVTTANLSGADVNTSAVCVNPTVSPTAISSPVS